MGNGSSNAQPIPSNSRGVAGTRKDKNKSPHNDVASPTVIKLRPGRPKHGSKVFHVEKKKTQASAIDDGESGQTADLKLETYREEYKSDDERRLSPKLNRLKRIKDYTKRGEIVNEKLKWKAQPTVPKYDPSYSPRGGDVKILNEKLEWKSKAQIDTNASEKVPRKSLYTEGEKKKTLKRQEPRRPRPRYALPPLDTSQISSDGKENHSPVNTSTSTPQPSSQAYSEKLHWKAGSKIDNKTAIPPREPKAAKMFNEKLHWKGETKVDNKGTVTPTPKEFLKVFNEKVKWKAVTKVDNKQEHVPQSRSDPKVFSEKLNWTAAPKIETKSVPLSPQKEEQKVFSEKLKWNAASRIDNKQEAMPQARDEPKVFSEKLNWNAAPKIETKYEPLPPVREEQKVFSEKLKWNAAPRIDNKQDLSPRVREEPKVFTEKLNWMAAARIDNKKDLSPRLHNEPRIFNEKLQWKAAKRIDNHAQFTPPPVRHADKVFTEKLTWDARPRVHTQNETYAEYLRQNVLKQTADGSDANSEPSPRTAKLTWKAESKVDTRNANFVPHKGHVTIHNTKIKFGQNAQSKINSLENVKWKPTVFDTTFDTNKKQFISNRNMIRIDSSDSLLKVEQ